MRRPCFTAGLPKLCTEVVLQSRTLHRIVVVSVAVAVPVLDMECVVVNDWWDVAPHKMG